MCTLTPAGGEGGGGRGAGDRRMTCLFENTTLSAEGIRSLIRLRGGLPTEHRFTAWKYLLRLPANSTAFAELVAKGPHPAALASLATRYPVRDRKAFRKTAVLISALAHWSPILAEVEFVPSWVFPFVVVFSQVRYVHDIPAVRGLRVVFLVVYLPGTWYLVHVQH